jgi:xylulokinase
MPPSLPLTPPPAVRALKAASYFTEDREMAEHYVIGIDIGTQGTKTALYSVSGRLVSDAFEASVLVRPGPGQVEEDPERQYLSVCNTIRTCLDVSGVNPAAVLCLAVDGQMAGTIGIGSDGRAVTPYDSWLDTRCSAWIDRMRGTAGTEVLARTGNQPSFNQGPKILYWKHERPEVYKDIQAFVQPGSYAAMRLCGLGCDMAFVDETYLHFSGFADNARACWDQDLCRTFRVDSGKLPHIIKSTEVVGGLDAASAALSGLPQGTPVAAGLGDTAASFLSCGAVEEGICVDVAGTASVFATTTSRFEPDLPSRIMGIGRSAVEGLWHPYAYINGGGMNLLWFAENIAVHNRDAEKAPADFDDLNELVQDMGPRMDDPYFIPHLEGRVSPADPGMRGAWAGLRWSHNRSHLYRAVLEAVGFEYGVYLQAIRKLYPSLAPREIRITGGGAKSTVWTQTKADILGLPFVPVQGSGGAPMGSAMVAAVAAGATSSCAVAAGKWLTFGPAVKPRQVHAGLYNDRFNKYQQLLGALSGFPDATEEGHHDRK